MKRDDSMKQGKAGLNIILFVNLIGAVCLIYFSIPYLTHDTTIPHPEAMLPAEAWDAAGMALTIGLFPLAAANLLEFLLFRGKGKYVRLLCFLPSFACFVMVMSYWVMFGIL